MGYGYIIGICIVLFVLLTGGFGVLLWLMLNRKEVKRSLLTHPRDRKGQSKCPDCNYDLTGLETDHCPECGRPIDPTLNDDLQTDAQQ